MLHQSNLSVISTKILWTQDKVKRSSSCFEKMF